MNKLVIFLALVSVVLTAPLEEPSSPIPILKQTADGPNADGSYSWSYETANGIQAQENGVLKGNGEESGPAVSGSYSFIGEDGQNYLVEYTADENGYVARGAHLPVAPDVPEAILKALEYNAAHPEEDDIDSPKKKN